MGTVVGPLKTLEPSSTATTTSATERGCVATGRDAIMRESCLMIPSSTRLVAFAQSECSDLTTPNVISLFGSSEVLRTRYYIQIWYMSLVPVIRGMVGTEPNLAGDQKAITSTKYFLAKVCKIHDSYGTW